MSMLHTRKIKPKGDLTMKPASKASKAKAAMLCVPLLFVS